MTREEELKAKHKRELDALCKEQANCDHDWSNAKYDPKIINEPIYETRFQGSDCYPEIVGFKDRKEPRWSRTCKKCGRVEYTKEQIPRGYRPNFS